MSFFLFILDDLGALQHVVFIFGFIFYLYRAREDDCTTMDFPAAADVSSEARPV